MPSGTRQGITLEAASVEFVKIGNLLSYLLLFGYLLLSSFVCPIGYYRHELAEVACAQADVSIYRNRPGKTITKAATLECV